MTDSDITIKRALISVYDKTGIVDLAKFLVRHGVEIISTGNTYTTLFNSGVQATEISDYTQSPEIMGGRVKTLHPKIHGGILGVRGKHDFTDTPQIDLVITNLYPFIEASGKAESSEDEIIEQIDIGGVTLIRAAAKNFHHVCVLTDITDYQSLNSIHISLDYRQKLATKAFSSICRYDDAIYQWLSKSTKDNLSFGGHKAMSFRYGENPHQQAAFYIENNTGLPKQIQGKQLSYNNILDSEAACSLISEFTDPTVAIIKHTNPCGVVTSTDILQAYKGALKCDPISSFGGIVAANREITEQLAICITNVFTEVVIAPSISNSAQAVFANKPNIRVLISDMQNHNQHNIKSAFGGFLVQDENKELIKHEKCVTKLRPNNNQDLYFAWKVCKHVKSNAIVICKNNAVLGIGAGQMSRIDSMNIAISKLKANASQGAVIASDAFFPFDDCVKLAAEIGISAIIQPGGSIRDQDVIQTADKHNIAMVFTGIRHFKH